MKKSFVSLSLMVIVGLTTVFANDKFEVNDKIKQSFKKEFPGVTSVKWEKVNDFQAATFAFYQHLVIAYFNLDGELLGYARDVVFYELPLLLIKSFEKHFTTSYPVEILEVNNAEGTFYRLTVEKQNKRYHIKADADGNILDVLKIKKY